MDDEGMAVSSANGSGDSSQKGGMSDGTFMAIAIFLFILAGIAWYIALHPGGITDPAFVTDDNPSGHAQNAAEVIIYFINKLVGGNTSGSGPSDAGASPAATPASGS
jgi:hypothetical protein